MRIAFALSVVAAGLAAAAQADTQPAVHGLYVEARTCDVFTGPCFANSEQGLTGQEALLVWKVTDGVWNGVDVSGLSVVAAVRAAATLGDTYHDPYPAKSVLLVDENATDAQRDALVAMAKTSAGKLLSDVVEVKSVPVDAQIGACTKTGGCAMVTAGSVAAIETRCLGNGDHICGNETAFYPPLTKVEGAVPAFTTEGSYTGDGLGARWDESGRRSAFIAAFAL